MLTPLHRGAPGGPTVLAFPHAGGSARFFRHWSEVLPGTTLLGVTYPGRDTRADESYADDPHGDDLVALARSAAEAIAGAGLVDGSVAPPLLVGHSMGAYVAYETAAALVRAQGAELRLAVSGQNPPADRPATALHRADDAELVADLVRQNPGSAPLWESDELRAMFLPAVREDYRLLETYVPTTTAVAELLVCHGDADDEVDPDRLDGWHRHAADRHPRAVLAGGHFYLQAPDVQLPRCLAATFGLR